MEGVKHFRLAVLLPPSAIEIFHVRHEPVPFFEPADALLAPPEQPAQRHVHEDPPGPRVADPPVAVASGVLMRASWNCP